MENDIIQLISENWEIEVSKCKQNRSEYPDVFHIENRISQFIFKKIGSEVKKTNLEFEHKITNELWKLISNQTAGKNSDEKKIEEIHFEVSNPIRTTSGESFIIVSTFFLFIDLNLLYSYV